ncbi:hypothetical protein EDD11_004118 [Mortierella claussenii]|nr:hypothetical protein EDD11_004118 [Mortierella claussenii]
MQVDELERIKLGYYFSNLESEQANLQLILQKTSTIVRAEVDIYERIANKGLNDAILEPMTTQGPDPYCIYPTTDEFSSIFSILPPTPIIPTSAAGGTTAATASTNGTSTPQPDSIMSSFYGYHETNPFSIARNLNNTATTTTTTTTTRENRHLFGDVSSIESKESVSVKESASVVTAVPQVSTTVSATSISTTAVTVTATATTTVAAANAAKDTMALQGKDAVVETAKLNQIHATEPVETFDQRAPSPEKAIEALEIQQDGGHDEDQEDEEMGEEEKDDKNVNKLTASTSQQRQEGKNGSQRPLLSSRSMTQGSSLSTTSGTNHVNGVDLRAGQHHHRNLTASSTISATPSELASSIRSHSFRSLSGSRSHHVLASTPDSPPVRGTIHIGQDSELLNNRDFSFSYEPTELLEQRSMHSQLNLSRHGAENGSSRVFAGFGELEEDGGGFGATPPSTNTSNVHAHGRSASQDQLPAASSGSSAAHGHGYGHGHSPAASISHSIQTHNRNNSQQLQSLRHHASDGQLSHSSSSILSGISGASIHSGTSSSGPHNYLHHRRSTGRIKTDVESSANTAVDAAADAAAMFDPSMEDSFLQSAMLGGRNYPQTEMRRGFDDGMPAFFADDMDGGLEETHVRPSSQSRTSSYGFGGGFMGGLGSGRASRRHSGSEQDLEKPFISATNTAALVPSSNSNSTSTSSSPSSLRNGVESVRMADGSNKYVSTTQVNEITV